MSDKILDIQDLTVSFDGFKALNNLNFSMRPGEMRVIIGPNGAGKTTFLDVITGKVQPTQGKVLFNGKNLRNLPEYKIARMGIGRKFQTPRVYLNLTVKENLDLVCNRNKNVFSTLFTKPKTDDKRTVGGLLETVGLAAKANAKAALLSHGEKQRLEIGMLVAQSPELLLVDEPAAGLTDEETDNVGSLLLALAESHTIIAIEHDMEFVKQIATDQVTVLHQGSVLCEGSMDQIQNDPQVIEVYLGEAPSISPDQMNMIRICASMAWADSNFTPEQLEVILTNLSQEFASSPDQQVSLQRELQNYLARKIPLEDLVPKLQNKSEKERVLSLSYEIIRSNQINSQEAVAYNKLLNLLDLPTETVQQVEQDIEKKYSN